MNLIKKITAIVLVICVFIPTLSFAEGEESAESKIYVFGDSWAEQWAPLLGEDIVSCAFEGALLSEIQKVSEYKNVGEGDVAILSYGFMAQNYRSDKTSEFSKNLDSVVTELQKRGATVVFASICSTRRQNPTTGKLEETKNFFTEEERSYAKKNNILYIDMAKLTCDAANKIGYGESYRIYSSDNVLSETGRRLCANEAILSLFNAGLGREILNLDFSIYADVKQYEKECNIDVLPLLNYCDSFEVYVKGGKSVYVNSKSVGDGDCEAASDDDNGKIKITFASAEKIQVAPVYEFDAGGVNAGEDNPYIINFRSGVYDIAVKKSEPLRANVFVNGYLIAANLDMPGTVEVNECSVGLFRGFEIDKDEIKITISGKTDKLEWVALREPAKIFDKKPRIFVAGDSTLCNYYPLDRTGNEPDGQVQTGWAQLLQNHTDSEIINLASSGDWAAHWMEQTFPTVEKEGKAGDIFIIQFGINDRDKSNVEEMTSSLSEMIDKASAKGMIPILVSPQISAGYGWGETSDIGKSDGGQYEEFFNAVRGLAEEKNCFYVDLTDLSAGWFSEIGREAVYKKYHLWDSEKNEPSDTMHLSYKGASTMCNFVVMALQRIKKENSVDFWGNNLDSLTLW
jgi:lysophospholipase L1-like esterase